MACIVHTGHDQGECWREHSGTTGWQKNLKTWFYIRVLTKILKDLAERIFCLTFQYRKKKWKGRITIICKHMHIWRNFLILQTFLISRFCKKDNLREIFELYDYLKWMRWLSIDFSYKLKVARTMFDIKYNHLL